MLLWRHMVEFIGKIQIPLQIGHKTKNTYKIKVSDDIEKLANKLKILKNSTEWCHDEVIYYVDKRQEQSAIFNVFHYFYLKTV